MREAVVSASELERLLSVEFPQLFGGEDGMRILDASYGACRVLMPFKTSSLRPGGTLHGGTMMILADAAMYVAVLASVGWVPLAVTTNLNTNFVRKPPPAGMIGEGRLFKIGKRLAVGEVLITSEADGELVAHATSTYSIPPRG